MGKYLDLLRTEDLDGRWFRLLEDFRYETTGGKVITVPKGFISDGASVPRFLWNIMPRTGKAKRPGVIHDWEYYIREGTRVHADRRFKKMLMIVGYDRVTASMSYRLLRMFAGQFWTRADVVKEIDGVLCTQRGPWWMSVLRCGSV